MSLHINAKQQEIAEKILLPGDPLRAKHIAEKYLENPICYNEIRGMYGFTGFYNGKRISVQGTGMGMPSMSIYANELIRYYNVKTLIRVGTCGSIDPNLKIKDLFFALGASTDSGINRNRFNHISYAPTADFELLQKAYETALQQSFKATIGNVLTCDQFYDRSQSEKNKLLTDYGIAAIDMETCELYTLAAKYRCQALTLMTVSDSFITGEKVDSRERESNFDKMVELALNTI